MSLCSPGPNTAGSSRGSHWLSPILKRSFWFVLCPPFPHISSELPELVLSPFPFPASPAPLWLAWGFLGVSVRLCCPQPPSPFVFQGWISLSPFPHVLGLDFSVPIPLSPSCSRAGFLSPSSYPPVFQDWISVPHPILFQGWISLSPSPHPHHVPGLDFCAPASPVPGLDFSVPISSSPPVPGLDFCPHPLLSQGWISVSSSSSPLVFQGWIFVPGLDFCPHPLIPPCPRAGFLCPSCILGSLSITHSSQGRASPNIWGWAGWSRSPGSSSSSPVVPVVILSTLLERSPRGRVCGVCAQTPAAEEH